MSDAPLALVLPFAIVLLLIAIVAGVTARAGWVGTLRRDGRLGVHSAAAMASDAAFAVANRVAAPIVTGAAVAAALVGILLLVLPLSTAPTLVIAILGLVGSIGLLVVAGLTGERAAAAIPRPAPAPDPFAGCGGCACGEGGCAALERAETAG